MAKRWRRWFTRAGWWMVRNTLGNLVTTAIGKALVTLLTGLGFGIWAGISRWSGVGVGLAALGSGTFAFGIVTFIGLQREKKALNVLRIDLAREPRERRPWATEEELNRPYTKGRAIKLVDLLGDLRVQGPRIVANRVFEECTLYGPAIVILPAPGMFRDNTFAIADDEIDAMFYEVKFPRAFVGPIVITNSVIAGCYLVRVGIIADADEIARWKSKFVPREEPPDVSEQG